MHSKLSDVYLKSEINARLEEASENLGLSKSMFLNILLGELFTEAQPEDIFYNRVKLCDSKTNMEEGRVSQ